VATVLLTASGAPGCPRLIRALEEAGHRVAGTDLNPRSAGSRLCATFDAVPRGDDPGFIAALAEVAERRGADVVFPTSSAEISAWAHARDAFLVPVMAGPAAGVDAASDKAETFAVGRRAGVPCPETIGVSDPDEFAAAARDLGYPRRPVVMKPLYAKGSRGVRVLTGEADERAWLLGARPGEHAPVTLESAVRLLGEGEFPPYLVQEFLEGPEETVDAIAWRGEMLLPMTRTREAIRAGLAMDFTLLDRPQEEEHAAALVRELAMDYFISVQFKGGRLMEINPRVSTIVYAPDLNPPALAVGLALGAVSPDEVRAARARVPVGRHAIRYYDQVEFGAG
jgi:carbamoyl-phosphate synthase large subunit